MDDPNVEYMKPELDDDLDELEIESEYCTCGHLSEEHVDFESECTECECESFKPQEVE